MTIEKLPLVCVSKDIIHNLAHDLELLGFYIKLLALDDINSIDALELNMGLNPKEFNYFFAELIKLNLIEYINSKYIVIDSTKSQD